MMCFIFSFSRVICIFLYSAHVSNLISKFPYEWQTSPIFVEANLPDYWIWRELHMPATWDHFRSHSRDTDSNHKYQRKSSVTASTLQRHSQRYSSSNVSLRGELYYAEFLSVWNETSPNYVPRYTRSRGPFFRLYLSFDTFWYIIYTVQ